MRVLDLFSGTQSLRRTLSALDAAYDVTSVDINEDSNPDICSDILELNHKNLFKPGDFDVVWASPPCTEYSRAKTIGVRDILGANRLVKKTLKVIKYLQPKAWFIENPQTGLLKSQPFMSVLPFYDVSYCKYGYLYKKQTRIWTNVTTFVPRVCLRDCDSLKQNEKGRTAHMVSFGGPFRGKSVSIQERYSIPNELVIDLITSVS